MQANAEPELYLGLITHIGKSSRVAMASAPVRAVSALEHRNTLLTVQKTAGHLVPFLAYGTLHLRKRINMMNTSFYSLTYPEGNFRTLSLDAFTLYKFLEALLFSHRATVSVVEHRSIHY